MERSNRVKWTFLFLPVTGAIVFSMDVQHIGYRYRTGVRCVCGGHRELVGGGAVGSESHDASLYPEPAVCAALHLAAKERQHGSLVVPGFLRGIADCLLRVLCSLFVAPELISWGRLDSVTASRAGYPVFLVVACYLCCPRCLSYCQQETAGRNKKDKKKSSVR